MEWINIHVSALVSPEFLGSDPVDRATWICLLRHCVMQENGGIIENCAEWKDRRWQQVCGVTLKEVRRNCELWTWNGNSLEITFYPVEKENEVKSKRAAGRETALKRWGKADSSVNSSATKLDGSSADTEGKGRKGNRKEMEGEGEATPPARESFDSEILDEAGAVTQAGNAGIPPDFAKYVYADWSARGGRDAGGVLVPWSRYAAKRWSREKPEWESGTHRGNKKPGESKSRSHTPITPGGEW